MYLIGLGECVIVFDVVVVIKCILIILSGIIMCFVLFVCNVDNNGIMLFNVWFILILEIFNKDRIMDEFVNVIGIKVVFEFCSGVVFLCYDRISIKCEI